MQGNPAEFEAIGNRLGFRAAVEQEQRLELIWHGPRFPALLCLGIALLLLFVTIPIAEAIRARGFIGPAAALWYFPVMNVILLGIAFYLLSQKRTIVIDGARRRVSLSRRSLHRTAHFVVDFSEIEKLELNAEPVYSGFAVAGSSAAESFPVPSLRLFVKGGASVLLDRGGAKRLEALGGRIAGCMHRPLETAARAERLEK